MTLGVMMLAASVAACRFSSTREDFVFCTPTQGELG
jgi:hypothetical protein